MRSNERKDSGAGDLFRSRLDLIVDMKHSVAKLSRIIDWRFLEEELGSVFHDFSGRPPCQYGSWRIWWPSNTRMIFQIKPCVTAG